MLDLHHLIGETNADVQVFGANSNLDGTSWATWQKRRGVSMVGIYAWGGGGGGGNGVVGANSTAAGGGGGGSAGQTILVIPAIFLPKRLYVQVGVGGAQGAAGVASRVNIHPDVSSGNNNLLWAGMGQPGNNASGATAGTGGAGASAITIPNMLIAGLGNWVSIAGMAGTSGGTTGAATTVLLPTSGLMVMGGSGGGGLPAAAATGSAGGALSGSGIFPSITGAAGGSSATTPPANGSNGYKLIADLMAFYPGLGGGSSHGSASGAGLVGGMGGQGGMGCGGGGGGGALTGSTQGLGGKGGDGLVIIIGW